MPVQQMSSFAGRLGARVAEASAEHKGKPIDTGNRRLPGGIKNGIAKVQSAYTKQQMEDKGVCPKGESFFRISAAVIIPKEFNGVKTEGIVISKIIPLCDIPPKVTPEYTTEGSTFSQNWKEFRDLMWELGVKEPSGPQYDITPQMTEQQKIAASLQIEAYYQAAMRALVDPSRPPTLISFSTRSWKPPKRPNETDEQYRNREPLIFEDWHGLADPSKVTHDPASMVTQLANGQVTHSAPSEPFEEPPRGVQMPETQPEEPADIADEVASLVEVAMADPNGETEDGAAASARLEDLAWQNGWTREQTDKASDWSVVGDMAISKPTQPAVEPPAAPTPPAGGTTTISVGYKAKFRKRTKAGEPLKNSKGEPLPPTEVEVVTVDHENKTCTVKTIKDGKIVADLRSKQPVPVKWEWLE